MLYTSRGKCREICRLRAFLRQGRRESPCLVYPKRSERPCRGRSSYPTAPCSPPCARALVLLPAASPQLGALLASMLCDQRRRARCVGLLVSPARSCRLRWGYSVPLPVVCAPSNWLRAARAAYTLTRVGHTAPLTLCLCRLLASRETGRPPALRLRARWARFVMGPQPAPIQSAVVRARLNRPLFLIAPHTGRAKNQRPKTGLKSGVWALLYNLGYRLRLQLCVCFLVGGIPPPPAALGGR